MHNIEVQVAIQDWEFVQLLEDILANQEDLHSNSKESLMEEEGAHAFLQGAGAHNRRARGYMGIYFSNFFSRSLFFKQDVTFLLQKDY